MSAAEVDATDVATGIALACRTHPLTDVRITVLGRRPRTFPNPDQENP
jgi:predicted Zn-dependent protease